MGLAVKRIGALRQQKSRVSAEHYLLNPCGFMFDEITAWSLIKIDLDDNLVEPSPHRIHRAGFVIHSAIHAAPADAHCVIHSHTRAGMAVSMMKRGLLPLSQHAMLFHDRVAYHDSEGFALDLDERRRLALRPNPSLSSWVQTSGSLY